MARRGQRKIKIEAWDMSDPRGMGVKLREFLEWQRQRNYSERTLSNRETHLGYFIAWCGERGIMKPSEVTKPILERYQRHLYYYRGKDGRSLSFISQYTYLVPVRAFFKWLTRNNHILYNPASELELPRLEKRLPRSVLNESEAERVLCQARASEVLGLRDRALLETLYSTAMRRMELIGLRVFDVDTERGTILVCQGKGKKDRVIPVGERAVVYIEKYLAESRPHLVVEPDEHVLFLTNRGESFTPVRLTQLVADYVSKADLGKRGSCHMFRHTCATLMLENGADIRFIQQLLGHVDLSTTQIYTQVSIRQLKQIHEATHPARVRREGQGSRRLFDPEEEEN
jgi:integrase/recombinase XerD